VRVEGLEPPKGFHPPGPEPSTGGCSQMQPSPSRQGISGTAVRNARWRMGAVSRSPGTHFGTHFGDSRFGSQTRLGSLPAYSNTPHPPFPTNLAPVPVRSRVPGITRPHERSSAAMKLLGGAKRCNERPSGATRAVGVTKAVGVGRTGHGGRARSWRRGSRSLNRLAPQ
jgi:hypothetical protein